MKPLFANSEKQIRNKDQGLINYLDLSGLHVILYRIVVHISFLPVVTVRGVHAEYSHLNL